MKPLQHTGHQALGVQSLGSGLIRFIGFRVWLGLGYEGLGFGAQARLGLRESQQDDPNQFYALAIGFTIIAGGHAVGRNSETKTLPEPDIRQKRTSGDNWGYKAP